jgi:hypothetical protein
MRTLFIHFVTAILGAFFNLHHPVHYSVTNIELKADSGYLSVAIKANTDDIEFALSHAFNQYVSIRDSVTNAQSTKYINQYFNTTLKFCLDNIQNNSLTLISLEPDQTETWFYFTIPCPAKVQEIKLMHALLFDVFLDQTNLIIFSDSQKEQGLKTTFYSRDIVINVNN